MCVVRVRSLWLDIVLLLFGFVLRWWVLPRRFRALVWRVRSVFSVRLMLVFGRWVMLIRLVPTCVVGRFVLW